MCLGPRLARLLHWLGDTVEDACEGSRSGRQNLRRELRKTTASASSPNITLVSGLPTTTVVGGSVGPSEGGCNLRSPVGTGPNGFVGRMGGGGGPAKMPPNGSVLPDSIPATPGKNKVDKTYFTRIATRWYNMVNYKWLLLLGLVLLFTAAASYKLTASPARKRGLLGFDMYGGEGGVETLLPKWGGGDWERQVIVSGKAKKVVRPVVLVTGAAGFVGYHLALALRKRGDGVVGLDNFNSYYDPNLKRARESILKRHGVMVVEGDINDGPLLARLFQLVRFTHVAHLAAQAGVRYALENPSSYIHSNVAGFVSVLEACKRALPQPSIVWASSSSVYGLNTKVPFSEVDRTDQPASLYAATKKAGEEIAHTYNHIYGLSLTALRFFTVYGPWGRPDMAYFSFTQNILDGKVIKVYQGSNKTDLSRDFTYIDDIIRGCVAALDTAQPSTGSGGRKKGPAQLRTFNLGNTQPVSVPRMVTLLEKQLKMKAKKHFVKMPRNGDVPFTHANVTRARLELGYSPNTDLKLGVKQFVKWYLSYYGEPEEEGSQEVGFRSTPVSAGSSKISDRRQVGGGKNGRP